MTFSGFSVSIETLIILSSRKLGQTKLPMTMSLSIKVSPSAVLRTLPAVYTWWPWVHQNISPGFYWHGWSVPPEQKPRMRTGTCLLFQLHDILFRGSYPGLYSFHCYLFMTALARLATDVCNTSPVEINCFTSAQFLRSDHSGVSNMDISDLSRKLQCFRRLYYVS